MTEFIKKIYEDFIKKEIEIYLKSNPDYEFDYIEWIFNEKNYQWSLRPVFKHKDVKKISLVKL